ncbi:MAG: hypothetical protein M1816_002370 [Peltula sp. TS41687]|nr:MAG: hypothetical protein M1816_002370 [Peltula sp. TS41687]
MRFQAQQSTPTVSRRAGTDLDPATDVTGQITDQGVEVLQPGPAWRAGLYIFLRVSRRRICGGNRGHQKALGPGEGCREGGPSAVTIAWEVIAELEKSW